MGTDGAGRIGPTCTSSTHGIEAAPGPFKRFVHLENVFMGKPFLLQYFCLLKPLRFHPSSCAAQNRSFSSFVPLGTFAICFASYKIDAFVKSRSLWDGWAGGFGQAQCFRFLL